MPGFVSIRCYRCNLYYSLDGFFRKDSELGNKDLNGTFPLLNQFVGFGIFARFIHVNARGRDIYVLVDSLLGK